MSGNISFIIPLLNEHDSLNLLYHEIKEALKDPVLEHFKSEIIFINDGSTDNSLQELKKLRDADSDVKIISFRKNLGKSQALNAGFRKASGDCAVTLDADLQDGPRNIPALFKKLEEGYDLVVGSRQNRQDSWNKLFFSKIFNFFTRGISGVKLHDFNSGLKVMSKGVYKDLYLYGELHRFIPILASQKGYKVTEVSVTHYPRKYGTSKYGWARVFQGGFDLLTVLFLGKFKERPLHFFGMLGGLGIILGIIFGTYLSYLHFIGVSIGRRPLLILAVLLILGGLQVFSIGLIAEMIVRKDQGSDKLPIDYEA